MFYNLPIRKLMSVCKFPLPHISHAVKEGILHFVNDLDVIGGDLTSMSVDMDRRLLDYVCGLDVEFSE